MSNELPFDIDIDSAKPLLSSEDATFLDCRRQAERDIASIHESIFIPMDELPKRLTEIPRSERLIVYCHLGGRSAMVTQWLRENGFENAQNLAGGIDAWSQQVDPSIPRYS